LNQESGIDPMKEPGMNLRRYRFSLGFFIAGLILSGITALPLQSELSILSKVVRTPAHLRDWIVYVDLGLRETYSRFPFFGYATDWLAFGHFVIAAFFILPFVDPARYRGVLQIGLCACAGVIVLALVCGPIRGIPFSWTLIDCSFGIVGAIPLLYCLHLTRSPRDESVRSADKIDNSDSVL
jgi:hypothetical protein